MKLDDIAQGFAEELGISLVAGRFLLAILVIFSATLAIAVALRTRSFEESAIVLAATQLSLIGFFTIIAWLQPWLLIMVALIIAILLATKMKKALAD